MHQLDFCIQSLFLQEPIQGSELIQFIVDNDVCDW